MIRFGRYTLDDVQGLSRGDVRLAVTPKSLAVLGVIALRAGQVVTKDELFRAVWPNVSVSDAALTSCIQELRYVLDDNARQPRFIATIHRRGYRFIARTTSEIMDERSEPSGSRSEACPLVGRQEHLHALLMACERAARGTRQVIFVSGEPGIGKTTLLEAFVARAGTPEGFGVTWGRCIEHVGAVEPYQPVLEALVRASRGRAGRRTVAALRRYAPTWLAQMPAVVNRRELSVLQRMAMGITKSRMLRELTDAIEAVTAHQPLIIGLEDLHWSDESTLDWIAAFAQRSEPARVVLAATFRDTQEGAGTLAALVDRLCLKGFASEIHLEGLDEAAVGEYLLLRLPSAPSAAVGLAGPLQRHTGGNPLFMVSLVDDLMDRGLLKSQPYGGASSRELRADELGVPGNVRRLIERDIDRLSPQDLALLQAASTAGVACSAAVASAGAGVPLTEAEAALALLARRGRLVREWKPVEWPDGTVAAGFEFRHALCREAVYRQIGAARRAELHRRVGACLETAYGERSAEIAAELAMHFERGGDVARSVHYLERAADNARRRSAYHEARVQLEAALSRLQKLPPGRDRSMREATLSIALGGVVMAMEGWGASPAERAYHRAHVLCREVGDAPGLFPALWGLWLFYWGRGPLAMADELSGELLAMAQADGGLTLQLQAHHAAWATAFSRGDFERSLRHSDEGMRMYDAERDAALGSVYGSHDAGVCARMFRARALALTGRPEEAAASSAESVTMAQALEQPFSHALALVFASMVHQARDDAEASRASAQAAAALAREHDFRLLLAWASTVDGWARIRQGDEAGLARMREGIAAAGATGSEQFRPYLLGLIADGCLRLMRADEGIEAVREALEVAGRTGESFFESELDRLAWELQLVRERTKRAGAV